MSFSFSSNRSNLPVIVIARARSSWAKFSVVSGPDTSSDMIAASRPVHFHSRLVRPIVRLRVGVIITVGSCTHGGLFV